MRDSVFPKDGEGQETTEAGWIYHTIKYIWESLYRRNIIEEY